MGGGRAYASAAYIIMPSAVNRRGNDFCHRGASGNIRCNRSGGNCSDTRKEKFMEVTDVFLQ